MSTFLTRIEEDINSDRYKGIRNGRVTVNLSDLKALIYHFKIMDQKAREEYEEDQRKRQAQKDLERAKIPK